MLTQLNVLTPPVSPAVPLDLVQRHCRIDSDYDSDIVALYLESATDLVQRFLNRALITQTLQYNVAKTAPPLQWPLASTPIFVLPMQDEWVLRHQINSAYELPRAPVQSVTSVAIGTWGSADTVLSSGTDYSIELALDPARVRMHSDLNWAQHDHLSVTYVAGYGATPSSIPAAIRHAILLVVGSLYENRGDGSTDAMPEAAKSLLWPFRLTTFA